MTVELVQWQQQQHQQQQQNILPVMCIIEKLQHACEQTCRTHATLVTPNQTTRLVTQNNIYYSTQSIQCQSSQVMVVP